MTSMTLVLVFGRKRGRLSSVDIKKEDRRSGSFRRWPVGQNFRLLPGPPGLNRPGWPANLRSVLLLGCRVAARRL